MVVDQTENMRQLSEQNARIQSMDSRLFALARENSDLRERQEELVGARVQLREARERLGSAYAAQVDAENGQAGLADKIELSRLRQQLSERAGRDVTHEELLSDYKRELKCAQRQVRALQKQIGAYQARVEQGVSGQGRPAEERQPTIEQQQRILRDLQTMLQARSQFQLVAKVSRLLDRVCAGEDQLAESERQQRRLEVENASYQKSVRSLLSKVYDMGQALSRGAGQPLEAPDVARFAEVLRVKEKQIAELRERLQKYGE